MPVNTEKKCIHWTAMELFTPPMHISLGTNSECTYLAKSVIKCKVMHIIYNFSEFEIWFHKCLQLSHRIFLAWLTFFPFFQPIKLVLRKQGIEPKKWETQSQNQLLLYLLQKSFSQQTKPKTSSQFLFESCPQSDTQRDWVLGLPAVKFSSL